MHTYDFSAMSAAVWLALSTVGTGLGSGDNRAIFTLTMDVQRHQKDFINTRSGIAQICNQCLWKRDKK